MIRGIIIASLLLGQYNPAGPVFPVSTSPWAHVHSITIDHTKAGSSNSSAFPVYFGGTFTWLKASGSGGDIQHSTTCCANTETVPADLIFTSDSGCNTLLNWDIPTWVSTTGVIEAWVQVPTVSSSVDTTIYACTGNSLVTTYQATYTSTWNSNYKAVWHFGDGTTLDLHDSTTNANNCTGVNTPTATTGLLLTGGAMALASASSQTADCGAPSSLNITTTLSAEAIVRFASLPGSGINPFVYSNTGASANNGYELFLHDGTGLTANALTGQVINASTAKLVPGNSAGPNTINTTYFTFVRYDTGGGTNNLNLFDNNLFCTQCLLTAGTTAIGSSANHFIIGNRATTTALNWNGTLDEIRISNAIRSQDWMTTQFNNMNSPSTFFTVVSVR